MTEKIEPNLDFILANLTEDKEKIISFWKENFPAWDKRKFDLFYAGSLFGPTKVMLLKDREFNRVVGITCLFCRDILVNGQQHKTAIAGDFAINKQYRRHGKGSDLQRKITQNTIEDEIEVIYATANDNSESISVKLGYDIVGNTARTVKIFKFNRYIKRIVRLSGLADFLAPPVNYVAKLFSKKINIPENITFEISKDFDSRFDDLWEKAKDQYPIIGIRTSQWLNWRYSNCTYKDFTVFTVINKNDDSIIGYYVYQVIDGDVVIADFFADNMMKNIDLLIDVFVQYQRTQEIDIITFYYFGDNKIINKYLKHGFILRSDNRSIIFYTKKDSPLKETLSKKVNWHYLDGDNDEVP